MSDVPVHATVRVGPQGRIVIPAEIRRQLALEPGDELIARVEDDHVVLQTREAGLRELQRYFDDVPRDVSMVDELIAERREAARLERQEMGEE